MLGKIQRSCRAVGLGFQKGIVGKGARRDNALHLALHRAFARRRITDLLANGDTAPQFYQSC